MPVSDGWPERFESLKAVKPTHFAETKTCLTKEHAATPPPTHPDSPTLSKIVFPRAMLVKIYGASGEAKKRYSSAECIGCKRQIVTASSHSSAKNSERSAIFSSGDFLAVFRLNQSNSGKVERSNRVMRGKAPVILECVVKSLLSRILFTRAPNRPCRLEKENLLRELRRYR